MLDPTPLGIRTALCCLCLVLGCLTRSAHAAPLGEWQALGQFELKSGKARVSDPSYGKDDGLAAVVPAKNGQWLVAIRVNDEGELGRRIAELLVIHESAPRKLAWTNAPFEVDVDSGTAGVFDDSHFRDDGVLPTKPAPARQNRGPGEAWYDHYVVDMKGDAQMVPFGVIASSGFGDGSYRCMISRGADGKVEAMRLVFIDDGKQGDDLRAVVRTLFQRKSRQPILE